MTFLADARAHLDKAREFLESARDEYDCASLEATFRRLLGLKSKSQYQASPVSATNARDAVDWAQRMYDVAVEVVTRPA